MFHTNLRVLVGEQPRIVEDPVGFCCWIVLYYVVCGMAPRRVYHLIRPATPPMHAYPHPSIHTPHQQRLQQQARPAIDKDAVARASGWPLSLRYKRCWQEAVASLFLTSPEARSRLGQQFYK